MCKTVVVGLLGNQSRWSRKAKEWDIGGREVPSVKGCRGLIVVKRQRGSVAYQGLRILEMGSSVGVGKINGKDKLLEYTVDLSLDFSPILHL